MTSSKKYKFPHRILKIGISKLNNNNNNYNNNNNNNKLTREEFKQMDQRTRKLMTMHKT